MQAVAIKNDENERGFNYAVNLTRLLMLSCGIWPANFSTTFQKILRPILIIYCFLIMLFQLIPFCLFMILFEKDPRSRLIRLGSFGFSLTILLKYLIVVIKNRGLNKCVQIIVDDWRKVNSNEDRKIMLMNAKSGRIMTVICIFLMYGGGMPFITIIPLAKGSFIVNNVSHRHLAYPSYYIFFNPHVRPIYDIIFTIHVKCGFTQYTITCAIYSIAIICVMHICSRIRITLAMIERLTDGSDNRLLDKIVKQHLEIFNFASKLENTLQELFLVEVFGCTFQLCILGYTLITEFKNKNTIAILTFSVLFVCFMVNIFILCYIGQILTEECESIASEAYMSKWYKLSRTEARSIVLIVHWNQRPIVLTAGKIIILSLESFSSIVKASAAYLNLLRTMVSN